MASLSKSPKQPTPKQEAVNENTSQARLRELAGVSTQLARIVAKNSNADPDLLRELGASADESTRKGVAANPNTPSDVLLKLGAQFPGQLLDNPMFSLLLLENPNLLADMPVATLRSLLKRDVVPEGFLEWAVGSSDEGVLLAVAMNPNTPKSALEKLTQSDDLKVVEAAKLHVNWVGEMSEGWDEAALAAMRFTYLRNLEDEAKLWEVGAISDVFLPALDNIVLLAIAKNPETPEHILKVLGVSDRRGELIYALAENPQTPVSVMESLVGESGVRLDAAANPNTPFASVQQFQMQLGLVLHPHTDSDSLRELAMSQWEYIRLGVVAHLNTPQDVLEQLALDPDSDVRMAVALNKNTPTSALQQLATHGDIQMLQAIAHHPHASADVLEQLAAFPKDDIDQYYNYPHGRALDFNPNIPTSLLKKLLKAFDPKTGDEELCLTDFVKNPHIDSDTLRELMISRYESIRFFVAIHPKIPQDVLEQVAKNREYRKRPYLDYDVRMAVALNKNTPTSALEQLAIHGDSGLLQAIACHPHASAKVLEQLAAVPKDDFFQIREVVALNPNTPTSLVEELALDPAVYSFSMSLAQNPNTPVSIIKQLTKYPNVQVQRCAKSTLQVRSKLKNHSADCTGATPALYTSWVASNPNSLEIAQGIHVHQCGPLELASEVPSRCLLGARIAEILNRGNRRLIAMNPITPLDTLRHIALNDEQRGIQDEAIQTLTQNANTLGEILQQLVEKAGLMNSVALATHPNTPVAALEELANSKSWEVRSVVAKNPNTPVTALEKLAQANSWKVRKAVAQNSNTPAIALKKLLQDKDKYVRAAAIANPNTPKNLLEQIEHLNSPETSQVRLVELATSQWLIIRERVALHPNTPVSLLEELAKDKNSAIRLAVAQNPNTPGSILEQLVEDKDKEVAIATAANPNTPVSILEELAQKNTRNKELQEAAVKNIFSRYPDKATAFLEKFLKSNQPSFTRLLVFLNPLAPSSSLAKNFRSSSWLERYAIAQNPNTPPHTLKFLATDGNRIVRAAASANLQQRNQVELQES